MLHCYAECHAECRYAECRFAECHYAECRCAKCRYAECHYAKCFYAKCRYAECHYAKCHGTVSNVQPRKFRVILQRKNTPTFTAVNCSVNYSFLT